MKKRRNIFLAVFLVVAVSCLVSCGGCSRTGQMLEWRGRGAASAAESFAADTLAVRQFDGK